MAHEKDQQTEPPSKRKLDRARKKGDVAVSRELAGACGLVAGCVAIVAAGGAVAKDLSELAASCWGGGEVMVWRVVIGRLLGPVLIVGGAAAAATLAALVLQTGIRFRLRLDFKRFNPVRGLGKLFGRERLVDLTRMLVKLPVLIGAGVVCLLAPVALLLGRWSGDLGAGAQAAAAVFVRLVVVLCVVAIAAGVLDRWVQRRRHHKRLRMTLKEVKDERKEQDGDPHIKSERRRLHRQMLQGVGLASLRRASVVVVNPTHVAVALGYDPDEDEAPWVIVAGRDDAAARIRSEAARLGVPVVQHVPLARALVRLDAGEEIPEALYQATAEVIRAIQA